MVMRVGGLASGMDIDSIVKNLMTAERMPLDKLKQKKQVLEWQRNDYRSMNTLLLDFRAELTQMKLTSKYRSSSVTTSDESRVSATAASSAAQASYSISQVDRLASAAYRVNSDTNKVTNGAKIDGTQSLSSQTNKFAAGLTWEQGAVGSKTITATAGSTLDLTLDPDEKIKVNEYEKMSVKVNGTTYTVVASDTAALANNEVKISETGQLTFGQALTAGASVKVDYVTDQKVQTTKLTAASNTYQLEKTTISSSGFKLNVNGTDYTLSGSELKDSGGNKIGVLDLATGKITFDAQQAIDTEIKAYYKQDYADLSITSHTAKGVINEKFLIQSSETLNQVISKVNASNAGVSLIYDSFSDKMSITRKETGNYNSSGTEMIISGSFDTGALRLGSSDEIGGENAKFTINGLETERQSNTFDMSGVSITLKATFAASEGATTLAVSKDSKAIYDNIKGFIDKYNTLIGAISSKTSEEKYRSYTPLTDDQRESLSDKQQEQWEEKAKSGLLRRDTILTGVLTNMRGNFSQPVSNSTTDPIFKQLASIGITTTANYLEGGKLEINEAKLKEAINNNPDAVEALFRGGGDSSAVSEKGIVHRLYDTVNATMDKLKERAGNTFSTNQQFALGRQLSNIDSSITRFESRLVQVEDRYWRQFTAMEKAIQQANSQSNYLMQQFSM